MPALPQPTVLFACGPAPTVLVIDPQAVRGLLEQVPADVELVVPEASRSGTRAWTAYEAAVRAVADWWELRAQG
ncbi:hypothetical protein ACFXKX_38065 [Streptomyces scopuliridis]|uniref:hypothetical protein n=1 Tax=Streptomyces scopuliridis TaxID=452529 RepID=UPI003685541A